MGLAAAKKKRMVGLDPNNTKWARNTDSFGHKILRANGWEPGQYLGRQDAAHAAFHTAASASHIRVVLKEDNLGLGASQNQGDKCTGLEEFQDLLGRLNGRSDEKLEAERQARAHIQRSLYIERRFGGCVKFVKGGLLVGDQVKGEPEKDDEGNDGVVGAAGQDSKPTSDVDSSQASGVEEEVGKKRSKKRKLEEDASDETDRKKKSKKRKDAGPEAETEKEKRKRGRRERKSKSKIGKEEEESAVTSEASDSKPRKERRRKAKQMEEDDEGSVSGSQTPLDEDAADSAAKKKHKKEKKKRKENKAKADDSSEAESKSSKNKRRKADGMPAEAQAAAAPEPSSLLRTTSGTSTPTDSGASTPIHHLSRRKFIAQKRLAFADPTALKQIFMIKSQS